jgi:hypothetical protein
MRITIEFARPRDPFVGFVRPVSAGVPANKMCCTFFCAALFLLGDPGVGWIAGSGLRVRPLPADANGGSGSQRVGFRRSRLRKADDAKRSSGRVASRLPWDVTGHRRSPACPRRARSRPAFSAQRARPPRARVSRSRTRRLEHPIRRYGLRWRLYERWHKRRGAPNRDDFLTKAIVTGRLGVRCAIAKEHGQMSFGFLITCCREFDWRCRTRVFGCDLLGFWIAREKRC